MSARAGAGRRIDVHSHLIPGVDDGCKTLEQSLQCARMLVGAGYTHAFCTPHVWPSYTNVTRDNVRDWTAALQEELLFAKIDLALLPGGELNLHKDVMQLPPDQIIPMALDGQYILTDFWADELPEFFPPAVRWLQSLGLTVILAHPERCRAVHRQPDLVNRFADLGLLLQGNLQCLSDPPESPTRQLSERYLRENRYFMLGSDTHNPETLPARLAGLQSAIAIAGDEMVDRLTVHHPAKLLPNHDEKTT